MNKANHHFGEGIKFKKACISSANMKNFLELKSYTLLEYKFKIFL